MPTVARTVPSFLQAMLQAAKQNALAPKPRKPILSQLSGFLIRDKLKAGSRISEILPISEGREAPCVKSEKIPIGSIKTTAQKKIRRVTTTVSKPRALIFTMQRE